MLTESAPKGPVSLDEIVELAQDLNWVEQVRLSEVGSDQWSSFEDWGNIYLKTSVVSTQQIS